MARFRGSVRGGRGETSRLGHGTSGLEVVAQSYSGDVRITMSDNDGEDWITIWVAPHYGIASSVTLYHGPVARLLEQSGRKTLVEGLAKEFLTEEAA